MLTKPLKINFTAGQLTTLKMVIEMIINASHLDGEFALANMVLTEWYQRNAGKFVFVPEKLRLTFTPAQAYAFNMLLKVAPCECEATLQLSTALVGIIDPRI